MEKASTVSAGIPITCITISPLGISVRKPDPKIQLAGGTSLISISSCDLGGAPKAQLDVTKLA